MEILLTRNGDSLIPADYMGTEAIQRMKHGEAVRATVKRTRNVKHHRKFFALLSVVYDNQDRYATTEQLLIAVKIATGYYDECMIGPKLVCIPRSIAFDKMPQDEFEQLYAKALELIVTRIIPGTNKADLERQVNDIIEGRS